MSKPGKMGRKGSQLFMTERANWAELRAEARFAAVADWAIVRHPVERGCWDSHYDARRPPRFTGMQGSDCDCGPLMKRKNQLQDKRIEAGRGC